MRLLWWQSLTRYFPDPRLESFHLLEVGTKEATLSEQGEGAQHSEYKPKLNLLHQERNVLCWCQGEFLTKRCFFQKNMVSSTWTLKIEVRTPACSLHSFLTDIMCHLTWAGFSLLCADLLRKMDKQSPVCLRTKIDHGKAKPHQQDEWQPISWVLP